MKFTKNNGSKSSNIEEIIKNTFKNKNKIIQTIRIHSDIFQELTLNLRLKQKCNVESKKKQVKMINYHVQRILKTDLLIDSSEQTTHLKNNENSEKNSNNDSNSTTYFETNLNEAEQEIEQTKTKEHQSILTSIFVATNGIEETKSDRKKHKKQTMESDIVTDIDENHNNSIVVKSRSKEKIESVYDNNYELIEITNNMIGQTENEIEKNVRNISTTKNYVALNSEQVLFENDAELEHDDEIYDKHDELNVSPMKSASNDTNIQGNVDDNNEEVKLENVVRNNREFKFNLHLFHDVGFTMTWTRQEYDEVFDTDSKKLKTYNDTYGKHKTFAEKENQKTYHDVMRRFLECSIVIHNRRESLSGSIKTITIYACCQFKTCKCYIFQTKFCVDSEDDIVFKILQDMKDIDHPKPQAGQIRGRDRIKIKKRLKVESVKAFKNKEMEKLAQDTKKFQKYKDLGACTSENTIEKICLEGRNDDRMHPDPWISLEKMAEQPNTMIGWLDRKPVTVGVMSKEMAVTVVNVVKKQGALKGKLDATGSAWNNPVKSDDKRFYMYSLVTQIKTSPHCDKLTTFIVCEFFTSAHGTLNIYINLLKIIDFIQHYTTLPVYKIFSEIVIDFSMAEMNACVKAFNGITLIDYLIACNILMEKKETNDSEPIRLVCVRLCSSHVSKIICNDVDLFKVDKSDPDRSNIKSVLFSLLDCTKISHVYTILRLLWEYMLSSTQREKLESYRNLKRYFNYKEEEFITLETHKNDNYKSEKLEDDEDPIKEHYKTIYENSPNFQKAHQEFKLIVLKKYETIEMFMNEKPLMFDFIMKVLKKYVTYIAFLTPILTYEHYHDEPKKNAVANRANNGVIEAHHKDTKTEIRRKFLKVGNPKIRVDDHIREILYDDVMGKINAFNLQVPRSRATRNSRTANKKQNRNKNLKETPNTQSNIDNILRSIQPVNNNDMMLKMNVSDIRKTEESYKKPSMSVENKNGSQRKKRKICRELFTEEKMQKHFSEMANDEVFHGVSLLPDANIPRFANSESTPLSGMEGKKNILISLSNISTIPENDDTTESIKITLSTIKEESTQIEEVPNNETEKSEIGILKERSQDKKEHKRLKSIEKDSESLELVGLTSSGALFRGSETILENGLISDIGYYCIPRTSKCDCITIVTFGKEFLKVGEWKSVHFNEYKEYISSFVIDYSLRFLSSLCEFPASFIMCELGACLFGWRDITKSRLEGIARTIMNSEITFCPIFHMNHFTLAVLYYKDNKFSFLDSLNHDSKVIGKKMLEKFTNNLKKFKDKSNIINTLYNRAIIWDEKRIKINCQRDSVHCGVHVINNAHCIFLNKPNVSNNFNPVKYRKDLLTILIQNSDFAVNMCPLCRERDNSFVLIEKNSDNTTDPDVIDWLKCDKCTRWWHTKCAQEMDEKLKNPQRIQLLPFHCIMCIEYEEFVKKNEKDINKAK